MTVTHYRSLIIFLLVVYVFGSFVDGFWPDSETEKVEEFIFSLEQGTAYNLMVKYGSVLDKYWNYILVSFVGFDLLILIGMFFFQSWARLLLIISLVAPLPVYFFLGPIVMSPASLIIDDISLIGYGALLALSFFSEVSMKFERKI